MNELWVARDSVGSELHCAPPEFNEKTGFWRERTLVCCVDNNCYPSLKIGQCRRLVLAEETSE